MNTFGATAMAVLAWCTGEALIKGKASMLGAASGAVAGLVAITPAAGNVGIVGGLVIVTATVGSVGVFDQVWIQAKAVLLTVVWSGVVSVVAYKIVDMTIGLRVPEDEEREGLDISSHGETAYNK